jgi:ABC-2 type transport system permease protein
MNAVALNNHTIAGVPGIRRTLGAYLEEIRCEALRLIRNPGLVIPVLIMPMALYALFAFVVTSEAMSKDPKLAVFLYIAFSVMAISMPAVFGMSTSLAMEREMGLLRLKRAQPAPTGSWLVAKIACGVGFGVLSYLPMLGMALGAGKLPMEAGAVIRMSLMLIACSIPFCAMGLMIGSLVKGSAAAGYANLVYLPGCYLSGMFFPLPASMHWQAPIWPQYHVIELAKYAADPARVLDTPIIVPMGILLGFTALFSFVAIWRMARKG